MTRKRHHSVNIDCYSNGITDRKSFNLYHNSFQSQILVRADSILAWAKRLICRFHLMLLPMKLSRVILLNAIANECGCVSVCVFVCMDTVRFWDFCFNSITLFPRHFCHSIFRIQLICSKSSLLKLIIPQSFHCQSNRAFRIHTSIYILAHTSCIFLVKFISIRTN